MMCTWPRERVATPVVCPIPPSSVTTVTIQIPACIATIRWPNVSDWDRNKEFPLGKLVFLAGPWSGGRGVEMVSKTIYFLPVDVPAPAGTTTLLNGEGDLDRPADFYAMRRYDQKKFRVYIEGEYEIKRGLFE